MDLHLSNTNWYQRKTLGVKYLLFAIFVNAKLYSTNELLLPGTILGISKGLVRELTVVPHKFVRFLGSCITQWFGAYNLGVAGLAYDRDSSMHLTDILYVTLFHIKSNFAL